MPPKEPRLNILFRESQTKRVRYFCYLMSTLGDLYLDEGPLWFHCDGATTQIVGCVSRSGSICSQKKHRTFVPPPRSAKCPSVSVWKASCDCAGCVAFYIKKATNRKLLCITKNRCSKLPLTITP